MKRKTVENLVVDCSQGRVYCIHKENGCDDIYIPYLAFDERDEYIESERIIGGNGSTWLLRIDL